MKKKQYGLLALGAVLTGLTLIFPQVGILEWFTLIPVALVLFRMDGDRLPQAYRKGFFTVFVYYFVIYHWFVYLYPLDFVGLGNGASLAVIFAGWAGLSLLQAIVGGLIFLAFVALARTKAVKKYPLCKPFLFAGLWVVFEWSSTLAWTGVPWGRLALGQVKMLPILQSASAFGSYFISFLLVAVNGLLAMAVQNGFWRKPSRAICLILAGVLFCGNLLFGIVRINLPTKEENTVTVGVVQGNIDSHEKWSSNSFNKTISNYEGMTRKAVGDGAELVVWPETALPYDLSNFSELIDRIENLAKECNVALIVGALWTDEEGNEYNSLFYVTADGKFDGSVRYDKRHLVPFGEYVPMRKLITTLIPPLAEVSALDDDLTAGKTSALFDTEWGKIGSLICFDSIYEQLSIDSVRDGAELMLISSNDSWFCDSSAIRQHLYQAQLRAVETGRAYVRSANTGISAFIGSDGRVTEEIGVYETDYAVQSVATSSERTLYTRIGNLFVYLCIAGVLLPALVGIFGYFAEKKAKSLDKDQKI